MRRQGGLQPKVERPKCVIREATRRARGSGRLKQHHTPSQNEKDTELFRTYTGSQPIMSPNTGSSTLTRHKAARLAGAHPESPCPTPPTQPMITPLRSTTHTQHHPIIPSHDISATPPRMRACGVTACRPTCMGAHKYSTRLPRPSGAAPPQPITRTQPTTKSCTLVQRRSRFMCGNF